MEYGFKKSTVLNETGDGRNVVLREDLLYVTKSGIQYKMPTGSPSDGASTPKAIWNLIPPFGTYWMGTVLHDGAYRNVLQVLNNDGTWTLATLTRDQSDDLLLEAMESLSVDLLLREAIYEGVHLGGEIPFDDDRRVKLKAYRASISKGS
jgi:hypothetical protein